MPFVPILCGGGEERVVREALRELRSRPELVELEPLLAFFAGFVLKSQVVQADREVGYGSTARIALVSGNPWFSECFASFGVFYSEQEVIFVTKGKNHL